MDNINLMTTLEDMSGLIPDAIKELQEQVAALAARVEALEAGRAEAEGHAEPFSD